MFKHLIVEKQNPDYDVQYYAIECKALSFDGGSLILFEDAEMHHVKAAFSPNGWTLCRWGSPEEIEKLTHEI